MGLRPAYLELFKTTHTQDRMAPMNHKLGTAMREAVE